MRRILSYGPHLKTELKDFIGSKKRKIDGPIPWGVDFLGRLEPFATSGKLLRGSVLCFAYETFSGRPADEAVLNAAMALELTHSALLIHDDIMDGDDTRRGRPSMHRQYQSAAEHSGLADSGRFGTNMAMSGGDAALFMAVELLGRSQAKRESGAKFYALFVDQLLITCAGQMQDVYFEARPEMPSKKAIHGLMQTKTASYTLALPLAMGAALAGESAAVLKRLQAIGIAGGTIFQIRDDELGVMGDSKKTGKPVGSDVKEGKKTLLYYYLVKGCSPAERQRIDSIFGNPKASAQDIAYVQGLVRSRNIAELLGDEVRRLQDKAFTDINKLSIDAGAKAELKELIEFCALRQV